MILEAGDWLVAQAAAPAVDGKFVLYVVLRVLHILAAIIIVGGLFYAKIVLVPAGADPYAGNRQVWARWVGIASLLLVVSGLMNFMNNIGLAKEHGTPLPPTYHMLFGIKFLLGLLVMFIAAILAGKTALADKFRQNMGRWLNIAWSASLAIVIIGALLRTFPR
jgi:putative copper export protein